ncbi:type IV toxin-antitoxin system AbiEi family antitoxin domain-containing protein [Nocardioides sp. Kera G14]|uniref:type IV toxin-antitoxin system AbiEi family antitoxin domain-containing protein n=1 Tax=Nocardioides sp. Kera G14 TaxID=2884264 RepID=UPI001D108E95|nr:type IV toxin-antitoxin system AbiEi family antitoxin domain-containing protein [Nocardioides sp. Kera G14]UDY24529.1 endonuclease domain-containing protein [Nocardioides sp. Kera G14]
MTLSYRGCPQLEGRPLFRVRVSSQSQHVTLPDSALQTVMREQLAYERSEQDGVVTWRQLIAGGWTKAEVRRAVRRRELARVHPGVYVDHTGPLTARQRAWAALLWAGGPGKAALCGPSVLGVAADTDEVHLAVDGRRHPAARPGLVLHRVTGVAGMIRGATSPPRLKMEHNVLVTIAAATSESEVVAALADTVGRFGTTAEAVRKALKSHPRLPRRALVSALLDDIELGTESVLEHGFLTRVERPHALPTPTRQAARQDGAQRRDLAYAEFGLVIELDGRLNHESWKAGNRDAARDLADLVAGQSVLRLRWQQVMEQSCETALQLARVLWSRGCRVVPQSCGPNCAIKP